MLAGRARHIDRTGVCAEVAGHFAVIDVNPGLFGSWNDDGGMVDIACDRPAVSICDRVVDRQCSQIGGATSTTRIQSANA